MTSSTTRTAHGDSAERGGGDAGADNRVAEALQEGSRRIASSTWGERVARIGLAARGVVFLILGYLVARIADGALGSANQSPASLPGIAEALDKETGGDIALGILAAGLALYALFSALDTVLHHNDESPAGKRWGDRILSGWGFVMYSLFAVYCIEVAATTSSHPETARYEQVQKTQLSADVLQWPGGVFWLGLLGSIVSIMGIFLVTRAARRSFRPRLERDRMSRRAWLWANVLGTIGYFGRACLFLIVGGCILAAAVEDNPAYGQGVNGAARIFAGSTVGPVVLGLVAAMLVIYGFYMFFETRYRRV
ncbi:MAG TPA: DUF1206 domain-containing protein [Jatrophihabitans sp.]|nr:DUF1206 domain-containing protein [Jatrophihabitans sp.]